MRRFSTVLVALLVMIGLVASPALAANVHFKGGLPTFTDKGTTLTVSGALAGLGNEDVTIQLIAVGSGTTLCTNPGGKQAPGQNKVPVREFTSETIPVSEIKNGNVSFTLATSAPAQPTAKQAGCPNNNWTARITDVDFTRATIIVMQGGEVVLRRTFTNV